jgi:hypothetical protein
LRGTSTLPLYCNYHIQILRQRPNTRSLIAILSVQGHHLISPYISLEFHPCDSSSGAVPSFSCVVAAHHASLFSFHRRLTGQRCSLPKRPPLPRPTPRQRRLPLQRSQPARPNSTPDGCPNRQSIATPIVALLCPAMCQRDCPRIWLQRKRHQLCLQCRLQEQDGSLCAVEL